jgi:hypothetical protein
MQEAESGENRSKTSPVPFANADTRPVWYCWGRIPAIGLAANMGFEVNLECP